MKLLLPERTVDSLFAFEFLSAAPTAVVWSPHNNRGAGTVDHEISGRRRFDIECKTIYIDDTDGWVVQVPVAQLKGYASRAHAPVIYLLPAQPAFPEAPWFRFCAEDPDASQMCLACANPPKSAGAVHQRRWAGHEPHFRNASPVVKLQPWFNHWAWCVPAGALHAYISRSRPHIAGGSAHIPAEDADLASIPGAVRLCHFLGAVRQDWATHSEAARRTYTTDVADVDERVWLDLEDWSIPADVYPDLPSDLAPSDGEEDHGPLQVVY